MNPALCTLGWSLAAVSLTACGGLAADSYGLDHGVASYDALKTAGETCRGQGGEIRLRKGFEGRDLSDYQCVLGQAR
jgi:hypothetical protein